MRITPLPEWLLTRSQPSFYDTESVTGLEASAKLYGKLNEIIEDYNKFTSEISETLKKYTGSTTEDYEIFQTALRQEFQDFIDTVTLKLSGYDGSLDDFDAYVEEKCEEYVNQALASGAFTLEAVYNETSESLDYTVKVV